MTPIEPRRRGTDTAEAVGLGELIRQHAGAILEDWETAVRQLPVARDLDRLALVDHIPEVLDRIADMVDATVLGSIAQLPKDVANMHALERIEEGFDLSQVVAEFAILRDCIMRKWEASVFDTSRLLELRVINQAIDRAVAASVGRFTQARDRTLIALDRIATEALESKNLDELLRRLLQVFVEATPAADTATILIREGELLRVRAAIGLEEEITLGFTLKIGEGFAGKVAAQRQAVTLHDAAHQPLVKSDTLRASGIRALYGVPLMDGGGIIGVAHMGSLTAREFSKQDKRMLTAMANRAASAIYQHVLRETAELEFRTLAENMPQLAWIADTAGSIYWFNQRWFDFTGTTRADMKDPGWLKVHHPDHAVRVTEKFRRVVERGDPWQDLFPLRGKEGRYRWFLSRAVPVRNADGAIVRWFGTNTDVTEQRFLANATELLSSRLDGADTLDLLAKLAVPDLADWCVVDLVENGTVSRVAIEHVDPSKIEMAREFSRRYPPRLRESGGVAEVIRTGEPLLIPDITDEQLAASARDDEHLARMREIGFVSCIMAPITARGRTLGALTLLQTESKRRFDRSDLETAVELARRAGLAVDNARLYHEAHEAVAAREEILAIVSHDLRNPLGAIDLAAELALQTANLEPIVHRQLDTIRRAATRMEHLLRDLLDTTGMQVGRFTMEQRREEASTVIREVVEAHREFAKRKSIELLHECELQGTHICCDRERLMQAFGNLLGNAIKFCRAGDVVMVRGVCDGASAKFSIVDTGLGIPPNELPHIFEPYWSAKRHARKGTGLGLYIAKGIVEGHRGTLSVESKLGEGTTFTISLPFTDPKAPC